MPKNLSICAKDHHEIDSNIQQVCSKTDTLEESSDIDIEGEDNDITDEDEESALQSSVLKKRLPVELREEDLEEKFVRGSGPGGQAVNKTSNCVQLRHLPSGIVVHCHETRERSANRKIARSRLRDQLDLLLNGHLSKIKQREKRAQRRKSKAAQRARKKYGEKIMIEKID